MSIVLYSIEKDGLYAKISQDKNSSLYSLVIVDSYGQTEKRNYISMKSAKQRITKVMKERK